MRQLVYTFVSCLCLSVNGAPDYYWRDYNGEIPLDAVLGSTGTYIAQIVVDGGGLVPGTIRSSYNKAIGVVNDKRYEASKHVKILCSKQVDDFSWQQVSIGVPINSTRLVEGGVEEGKVLYIGRSYHQDKCKIGKVSRTSHTLKIWKDDGGAETLSKFEVLEYGIGGKGDGETELVPLADERQRNDIRTKMI